MRRAITGFSQASDEQIHESWERLKELSRKCPHHGLFKWQVVQAFYEGLTEQYRHMVDAPCGGNFMSKSEDEAYDLFETLSENLINHASLSSYERSVGPSRKARLYEIKNHGNNDSRMDMTLIAQKLDKVDLLAQKMDQVLASKQSNQLVPPSYSNQLLSETYALCAVQTIAWRSALLLLNFHHLFRNKFS